MDFPYNIKYNKWPGTSAGDLHWHTLNHQVTWREGKKLLSILIHWENVDNDLHSKKLDKRSKTSGHFPQVKVYKMHVQEQIWGEGCWIMTMVIIIIIKVLCPWPYLFMYRCRPVNIGIANSFHHQNSLQLQKHTNKIASWPQQLHRDCTRSTAQHQVIMWNWGTHTSKQKIPPWSNFVTGGSGELHRVGECVSSSVLFTSCSLSWTMLA